MAQSGSVTPPKYITNGFSANFQEAVNVEWHHTNAGFEAVFHEKGLETIAQFNKYGALTEARKNVTASALPDAVNDLAGNLGEIMNAIIVSRKNQVFYEIIYRDKLLNRFLLLIDNNGTITKNEPL